MHAAAPPADHLDERVHARRWIILATLCMTLIVIVMDNTILNIAIPNIVKDLDASNSELQWIVDSYTLVFASLLLTTGSLGDRFGRKLALRVGMLTFAGASALAAFSQTALQLIVCRSLMGIGGALMMPSTLSILINVFRDPRERARAIAIWAAVSGIAVAAGPLIGGFLLAHFSWSSVFWVNVPIGIIALVAGHLVIPESKDPTAPRLDPAGTVLSFAGLGSLLYAIIEVPSYGWSDPKVMVASVLGVVTLTSFVLWERRTDHPMLDMSFFSNPRFSAANASITLTFFAMFGSLFLMTQYWQLVHGYSPLQAGVRVLPFAVIIMVVAPLSARFVEFVGTKIVVAAGLLTIGGGLGLLSTIETHSSYLLVISFLCVIAVGCGLVMAPATESVMGALPREKAGVGSAVNDTTRQVGGAMGVAICGSLVANAFSNRIDGIAGRFRLSADQLSEARSSLGGSLKVAASPGIDGARFAEQAKDAFVVGLNHSVLISAAVAGFAAIIAFRFLPARAADPLAREVASHPHDSLDELPDPQLAGTPGS